MEPVPRSSPEAGPARPRPPLLAVVGGAAAGSADSGPAPERLAQWVQAVAVQADRQAFEQLFRHFAPRIRSYLARAGTEPALAEELAQEAMVLLWRKAALFDPGQAAVSTWVFTIARNLRVDAFRRQGAEAAGDADFEFDSLPDAAPAPEAQVEVRRRCASLQAAMARLPAEQAQVLRLSYYEDEPHARIAERLGIPLGTVKSRMRLAVSHLRSLLQAESP